MIGGTIDYTTENLGGHLLKERFSNRKEQRVETLEGKWEIASRKSRTGESKKIVQDPRERRLTRVP